MLKLVRPVKFVILAVVRFAVVAVIVLMFAKFVIEFCALVLNEPLKVAALIVPLAVMFWIFARFVIVACVPAFKVALIVPPTILPVTVILLNVPLVLFTAVALKVPT